MQLSQPVRPSAPKPNEDGELESINITPSANGGYSVNVSRRPKPRSGKPKDIGCCYQPPTPYTFESFAGLETFLRKTLGGGKPEAAKDDDDEDDEGESADRD